MVIVMVSSDAASPDNFIMQDFNELYFMPDDHKIAVCHIRKCVW